MQGWLRKEGHVMANWKQRFFTLVEDTLTYYEDEECLLKKGSYKLTRDSLVEEGDNEGKNKDGQNFTLFRAKGENGSDYLFMASQNDDECTKWIEEIQKVIKKM